MAGLAINFSLSLVEQIINFTVNELTFPGKIAGDVHEVKAQLERMQAIVQSRGERYPSVKEILVKDLGNLAHRIEDVLNGIMLHEPHHSPSNEVLRKSYEFGHNLWHRSSLKKINAEIQRIQHDMKNIYDVVVLQVSGFHDAAPRTELQHHISQSHQDSEILGLKESKQRLMSQVMNTMESNCIAVMVVGPPGSGKTVLAKSIYEDDRVRSHFMIQACARLSPRFDVANVLSHLLSQVRQQIPHSRDTTTGDVANDLKNSLKGKRYVVLLDDVWNENHWKAIKLGLPDDSNGSRVVITSTKMDVACSIAASSTQIHLVDGLKRKESWSLFCRKAFRDPNGACPRDLKVLCKEIVHKCEGSPLGILAVATLLGAETKVAGSV